MNTNISSTRNSTAARQSRNYSKINAILLVFLITAVAFVTGCKKDDFDGEIAGLCPVVTSDPADGAVDVAVNKTIGLTFNTDMRASTVNATTVLLKLGANTVTGVVGPGTDGKSFTFNPNTDLEPFTTYTGTVTTGATDTLRTAMAENYEWSFKTKPRITLSSDPENTSLGGATSGAGDFNQGSMVTVTATPAANHTFVNWTKEGLNVSTDANYQFTMAGNVSLVAHFIPILLSNRVTITSYTDGILSNIGGITTGTGAYVSGSSVTISAFPNSNYSFAGWTEDIVSTTTPLNFTITTNRNIRANFTSGGPIIGPAIGPILPSLGGAASFSILTKSGISTTGITLVNGNIGVSPAAATAITGFGLIMDSSGEFARSPLVTGGIYASNYAAPTPSNMTTAISNMENAYTTANNLVTPAPVIGLGAGNISGLNLAPGLYKWSTGVLIDPNTTVTLTGGPNDTWVLQIAGDLTVSNSARVQLAGGAQAKNIIWVVAVKATLGTQARFSGNILTKELISLNNGAVVTGRLLAQTAVTLIGSTVIQP